MPKVTIAVAPGARAGTVALTVPVAHAPGESVIDPVEVDAAGTLLPTQPVA